MRTILVLVFLLLASPALAGGPPIYSKLIVNPGSVARCREPLELRSVSSIGESVVASGLSDLDCVRTIFKVSRLRLCCGTTALCGLYTDRTSCSSGQCAWAQCVRTFWP